MTTSWGRILELDQACGVHRDDVDLDSEALEPLLPHPFAHLGDVWLEEEPFEADE